MIRKIRKVQKAKPTIEGAGVHLKRAFGFQAQTDLDPFLLFDDFRSEDPEEYLPGFPWHPHRGIETITYVLAGDVEHGDSMGNKGVISAGDVQWMTAGSGVIHQEMPQGDENGRMWGFQLWANLPAKRKMMDPRYRDVKADTIPEVDLGRGVKAKVVCGKAKGVEGPVQDIVVEPGYLDVRIPAQGTFEHPVKKGHNVFAYVFSGGGFFDPGSDSYAYEAQGENYFDLKRDGLQRDGTLVVYGDGDSVSVRTDKEPVRFLLVSGRPLKEPVAWWGPIVMNTAEELKTAFEEYEAGTFIKRGSSGGQGRV